MTSFENNVKSPHFRSFVNVKTQLNGSLDVPVIAPGGYSLFHPSFYPDNDSSRTQISECPQGPTQLLKNPLFSFQNRRGKVSLEIRDEADSPVKPFLLVQVIKFHCIICTVNS